MLTVRPAHDTDGEALARLALACPMEGLLTLASLPGARASIWERFAGPRTTWVAELASAVVGSVSLAQRSTRIEGHPTRWGYLGELRVMPDARRSGVGLALARAAVAAERDAQSRFTMFTMLGGNRAMTGMLHHLHDLPRAAPLATMRLIQWLTVGVSGAHSRVVTRPACPGDLPEMHRLLSDFWTRRALGPVQTLDEFAAQWALDESLSIDHAVVALRGTTLVGCGALWDRRPLRQEVVQDYRFPLSVVAHALQWYTSRRGGPTLPAVGQPLPLAAVRYFAAHDLPAARAIRDALLVQAAERGLLIVMLGLDVRDPLAAVARGRLRVTIPVTVWAGQVDRRIPDLSPLQAYPAFLDFSLV